MGTSDQLLVVSILCLVAFSVSAIVDAPWVAAPFMIVGLGAWLAALLVTWRRHGR